MLVSEGEGGDVESQEESDERGNMNHEAERRSGREPATEREREKERRGSKNHEVKNE